MGLVYVRHELPIAINRAGMSLMVDSRLLHAALDASPLGTSTILPMTPPLPSNSCACLASERGNRCETMGFIFILLKKLKERGQILSEQGRS
jgi:hypothetical protein